MGHPVELSDFQHPDGEQPDGGSIAYVVRFNPEGNPEGNYHLSVGQPYKIVGETKYDDGSPEQYHGTTDGMHDA